MHDPHLRNLVQTQCIQQNVDDGKAIVLPDNAFVHPLAPHTYNEYKTSLGGVTAENK